MQGKPWLVAFVAAIALSSGHAYGVQRETCMGAAESAQELRKQGKLREARAQLEVCANKGCPSFVRTDCAKWLAEVEREMPSALLRARDDAGAEITDVRVLMDERVIANKLSAAPNESVVEVDPGTHTFRFEQAGGRFAERRVTFAAGEKMKAVAVTIPRPPTEAARREAPLPVEPSEPAPPVAAYVLVGVSAVALGSFGFFAASGASEYSRLEETCKPRCTDEQTSGVESKFLVANVSLAVSALALGAAAVIFFTRPTAKRAGATLLVQPMGGGAAAGVVARF